MVICFRPSDLAVNVLLESHEDKPELVRRFVEEAQIGGQLQHPGIVPVYELGAFANRRPYFTMKLVKGRTLASLLTERESPAHDLPRFLSIFESICQTVAYAHARGVIHRDLKPSNVMVGSLQRSERAGSWPTGCAAGVKQRKPSSRTSTSDTVCTPRRFLASKSRGVKHASADSLVSPASRSPRIALYRSGHLSRSIS